MCVQPSLVQALFTVSFLCDNHVQMCFPQSFGLEFQKCSKTSIQSTQFRKNKQQFIAPCILDYRTEKAFSTLRTQESTVLAERHIHRSLLS